MADKKKEAYWKGYNDYKKCGGQANSNPLTEFFHPSYNPPSEHQEAYKAGWERMQLLEKSLMKLTWILLLGLVVGATSCSRSPDVSVEGEVWRALRETWGLSTAEIEYKVKLTIRNTGSSPLAFDQIQTDFYSERGRHLPLSTFAYDPKKGVDTRAYLKGVNQRQKIAPSASVVLEVGTDGYTYDLLADAGGKPLRFSVSVLLKGKTIAGPYVALLPPLNDLPYDYELAPFGGQKPRKLSFVRE